MNGVRDSFRVELLWIFENPVFRALSEKSIFVFSLPFFRAPFDQFFLLESPPFVIIAF